MRDFCVTVVFVSALVDLAKGDCYKENWSSSISQKGTSKCNFNYMIKGFYRASPQWIDHLGLIEGAECCDVTSSWTSSPVQTVYADWMTTLDNNNKWVYCPQGYYLNGLYRSVNGVAWLNDIDDGSCMKPADHPTYYGHCYIHYISSCFNDRNYCGCNDSYYVIGLFRGDGASLNNLDALQCCKMASDPEPLDDISKVKTRIMDMTQSRMAYLASYLGFSWCHGCRSQFVGDDFYRDGNTWRADQTRRCEGGRNNERLSIGFADWKFELSDIQYGDPVTEELIPQTIDSGTIYNNHSTPTTYEISRIETSVVSVTHTKTTSWTTTIEASFEVNIGVYSETFRFAFENTETTESSTGKEHSKTFQINTSKTLAENSSVRWRINMYKTRTTTPYRATIVPKFSTKFQGFLKSGGGYYGSNPNFHIDHRGRESASFNYVFGDDKVPFYKALKGQSESNSYPWMWDEIKKKYSYSPYLIDYLCNTELYSFTLTGQFEAVEGNRIEILFEENKNVSKRSVDHVSPEAGAAAASSELVRRRSGEHEKPEVHVKYLRHVARAGLSDPPAPKPRPPPEVKVDIKNPPVPFPFDIRD